MALTSKRKETIRHKYKNHCAYTGKTLPGTFTVDHIVPKCRGGTDASHNLMPCLRVVNILKADLTLDGFKLFIVNLPHMTKRTPAQNRLKKLFKNFDGEFYFEKVDSGKIKCEYSIK